MRHAFSALVTWASPLPYDAMCLIDAVEGLIPILVWGYLLEI